MATDNETVQVENTITENEDVAAQGTTDSNATGSLTGEPESTVQTPPEESTVSKAEYDKIQKELQKLEMERNNLRNRQEEDRRKSLEESNEYKTLYEETQARLAEIEQAKEQETAVKEASKLREDFIDSYPDETVKKAAKALIERNPSNLSWGDVETEDQAKENIFAQLDALKETLGIISEARNEEEFTPEILANNPSTNTNTDPVEALSWEKMREVLPKADPR